MSHKISKADGHCSQKRRKQRRKRAQEAEQGQYGGTHDQMRLQCAGDLQAGLGALADGNSMSHEAEESHPE